MSAIRRLAVLMTCSLLAAPALAQTEAATGLIFTPKSQYDSIPLASTPYAGSELPRTVDLSADMPPPGDQGDQQSCVAWAVAYALKSFQERREMHWALTTPGGGANAARVFSPSFIYNQINDGRNAGTYFHNALNLVAEQGAAIWSDMPYTRFDAPVPATARSNAKRYRIDTWRRVNAQSPREVKAQLNAGFPVLIGAMVDQGFRDLRGADATWRTASGQELGGHAMVVVGYDDDRRAYRLLNSWGTGWGDGGYAWVGYDHFANVVGEAYVAQDARNGTPPVAEPETVTRTEEVVQPPEARAEQASLTVSNFAHNINMPGAGFGMMISGTTRIPAGVSGAARVVVNFAFGNGNRVLGLHPAFAMPDGQAATASTPIMLNGTAQTVNWSAFMPYCALNVPKGQMCLPFPTMSPQRSDLVAIPTLYLNNFGAAQGSPLPFFVVM